MSASARSGNPDVPIPFGACDPSGTFVFVSYAHGDKALVYPELRRIRSFGIRVWYDEGIEPGSEWPEAIAAALNRAAAFVVMITPGAVASRNVRNEINAALRWGKPVFAVHLAQTELPKGLELQMGAVQAVMRWRMDEASYTRKLGKALASYGEAMNEAPPAEPPALTVSRANTPTPPPPLTPSPVPLSRLARTLTGHTKAVWDVTFSPDGRLLVTSAPTGRRGCGTRPPASSCASSPPTKTGLAGWRSARTVTFSPPPAPTGRRGCGTRSRVSRYAP
jgi:hypothetical protein